jgi:hypothetical protein
VERCDDVIEEKVSKESAIKNIYIMAERLAYIHYAFAKTLVDEFGEEQGRAIASKAIEKYGSIVAEIAQKNLETQGLEPILENYKDLPSWGWDFVPVELPPEKPYGFSNKLENCPLANVWKNFGKDAESLGRIYCYVDQAKYGAFGKGYRCIHDKNILDGDEYCIIRVELDGPEDR